MVMQAISRRDKKNKTCWFQVNSKTRHIRWSVGVSPRYRVHKFTINKNSKMNQTRYQTIINCIFVFMQKMVIPVNTEIFT